MGENGRERESSKVREKTVDKKELFETMPVSQALLSMAVPTVISQLINLIYNTADTIYLGMTGDAYKTAAVTLAFTLFMMNIAISNLFGVGGGSLLARLSGAGQEEQARSVSAFSVYGSVVASVAYSLLIFIFQDPLLTLLGASANTMEFAKQYVWYVVVLGNLPTVLSGVAAQLLRNVGYSGIAGAGLSAGGVLNIALDPLFMFVLMPKGMEVAAAAIATLISNILACIFLVYMLWKVSANSPISLSLKDARAIRHTEVANIFRVGVPSALLNALFDVANIFLNALMAAHGDLELAAIGIVMKIERLPNAINVGIGQGMMPIVAYNFASGNHKRMTDTIRTARIWGVGVTVCTITLFMLFSPQLCQFFLSTTAGGDAAAAVTTLSTAALFLRIRCLASPFQFLNYNTSFCMQAVGYGKGTFIHATLRQLGFYIPFMFLLNYLFGVNGLASAVIFGEMCGAALALFLFERYRRKAAYEITE